MSKPYRRRNANRRVTGQVVGLAIALLTAAGLSGCATAGHDHDAPLEVHAVDRFVLVAAHDQQTETRRSDEVNPVSGAAAGALFGPLFVLTTVSYLPAIELAAVAPALGPLAGIGLVFGSVYGSVQAAKIHRSHGADLSALERQLSNIALQRDAENTIAAWLAQHFDKRFAGLVRALPDPPVVARRGVNTALTLQVRDIRMRVDHDGQVTLEVSATLRIERLPQRTEQAEWDARYVSPSPLLPADLAKQDGRGARRELARAWQELAREFSAVIERAPDAPRGVAPSHREHSETES